jgi:hypothetical protein
MSPCIAPSEKRLELLKSQPTPPLRKIGAGTLDIVVARYLELIGGLLLHSWRKSEFSLTRNLRLLKDECSKDMFCMSDTGYSYKRKLDRINRIYMIVGNQRLAREHQKPGSAMQPAR